MSDFYLKSGCPGPVILAKLQDDNGQSLDMTSVVAVTFNFSNDAGNAYGGTAEITDLANAVVRYSWPQDYADLGGTFKGNFTLTYADGHTEVFPEGNQFSFDVSAFVDTSPVTAPKTLVSDFFEPVRAFLGDFKPGKFRKYEDQAIASVVRSLIRCGQLPGYSLDPSRLKIVPPIADPAKFGLLTYKACRTFVTPNQASYSFRTKALGETFGNQRDVLWELQNAIEELENPTMFATWQSFAAWTMSLTGMDIWAHLSEMQTNAPIATVTIGRQGLVVSMN